SGRERAGGPSTAGPSAEGGGAAEAAVSSCVSLADMNAGPPSDETRNALSAYRVPSGEARWFATPSLAVAQADLVGGREVLRQGQRHRTGRRPLRAALQGRDEADTAHRGQIRFVALADVAHRRVEDATAAVAHCPDHW